MKKRIAQVLLVLTLSMSLTACGSIGSLGNKDDEETAEEADSEEEDADNKKDEDAGDADSEKDEDDKDSDEDKDDEESGDAESEGSEASFGSYTVTLPEGWTIDPSDFETWDRSKKDGKEAWASFTTSEGSEDSSIADETWDAMYANADIVKESLEESGSDDFQISVDDVKADNINGNEVIHINGTVEASGNEMDFDYYWAQDQGNLVADAMFYQSTGLKRKYDDEIKEIMDSLRLQDGVVLSEGTDDEEAAGSGKTSGEPGLVSGSDSGDEEETTASSGLAEDAFTVGDYTIHFPEGWEVEDGAAYADDYGTAQVQTGELSGSDMADEDWEAIKSDPETLGNSIVDGLKEQLDDAALVDAGTTTLNGYDAVKIITTIEDSGVKIYAEYYYLKNPTDAGGAMFIFMEDDGVSTYDDALNNSMQSITLQE